MGYRQLLVPATVRKLLEGIVAAHVQARVSVPRFEDVTETTGVPISEEGARMLYTRYHLAAEMARGRRVLEIGCAAGQGLGLISKTARLAVGGDFSMALLRSGSNHYRQRVPFVRLSAERLPFTHSSFDLVLFFEASYYVPELQLALREIVRVLDTGGMILFVNANPERPDFIRSPHSTRYHSSDEFRTSLVQLGFRVTTEAAFPVELRSAGLVTRLSGSLMAAGRQMIETLGLTPKTLRGRARLKRLVYGRLSEVPAELPDEFASLETREPTGPGPVIGYKVIYVLGSRD